MQLKEGIVFVALAAGIHVALWSVAPEPQGASSGGSDGSSALTIQAATASQTRLVAAWTTAPEVAQPPTVAAAPRPADAAPRLQPLVNQAPDPTRPDLPALPDRQAAPAIPDAPPPPMPTPPQTRLAQPNLPTVQPDAAPRSRADTRPNRSQLSPPIAQTAPSPPDVDTTPTQPRQVTQQAQASTPQPQARTEGTTKTTTPSGGGADNATQSATVAAKVTALQAKWGARIQRKVHQRMAYPRAATGAGTARVALTVDRSGRLTGLNLTGSSGQTVFDQAALDAVRRAGRFPKAPRELTEASYTFTLALTFRP